jgi:hypothetical protein
MNNAVAWDVALVSCENCRFGGMCRFHLQGRKILEGRKALSIGYQSSSQMLMFSSLVDFSSETSVLTRYTRLQVPEDDILHSHCCENFKSYIIICRWSAETQKRRDNIEIQIGFRNDHQNKISSGFSAQLSTYN